MKRLLFVVTPIILAILTFTSFSFFLSQNIMGKGALQVTSLPISNVYLNGKLVGKTPLCKCEGKDMLPVGDYTIKLIPIAGDNLEAYEQRITITKAVLTVIDRTFGAAGQSSGFVINLTPLTDKNAAQLFVSSYPSGASLSIDNNDAGNTPVLVKNTTASDHDLLITKSGYKDKAIHIQTHPGYQLNAIVSLALMPPDASSSAAVETTPLTPTSIQQQKIVILSTPVGFLRVRTEPSVSGSESAQVKPGDVLELTDEQDGWYKVKLKDGTQGWISATYARKE